MRTSQLFRSRLTLHTGSEPISLECKAPCGVHPIRAVIWNASVSTGRSEDDLAIRYLGNLYGLDALNRMDDGDIKHVISEITQRLKQNEVVDVECSMRLTVSINKSGSMQIRDAESMSSVVARCSKHINEPPSNVVVVSSLLQIFSCATPPDITVGTARIIDGSKLMAMRLRSNSGLLRLAGARVKVAAVDVVNVPTMSMWLDGVIIESHDDVLHDGLVVGFIDQVHERLPFHKLHLYALTKPQATTEQPPPPQATTELLPQATELPPPPQATELLPQATELPPPPQVIEMSPRPHATKMLPPQAQATEQPPPPQATELPPPPQATELLPPPQATELPPPPQATELLPQATENPPPPQATELPPPPQATELLPPPQATELLPPPQATELLPPPQATELLPQATENPPTPQATELLSQATELLPQATENPPTPQATELLSQANELLPQVTENPPTPQATELLPQATELLPQATELLPQATENPPTPQATELLPQATELLPHVMPHQVS